MIDKMVLIVEDDPLQKRMYLMLAKKYSFSVQVVETCLDALALIRERPDSLAVVFMDLGIAEIDGCQCTKMIRQLDVPGSESIPIVALTGHSAPDYQQMCFDAGMNDFLGKPFSLDQFKNIVFKWLGRESE